MTDVSTPELRAVHRVSEPDECYHCKQRLECDCAFCGKSGKGVLDWLPGKCQVCQGTGWLVWRSDQSDVREVPFSLPTLGRAHGTLNDGRQYFVVNEEECCRLTRERLNELHPDKSITEEQVKGAIEELIARGEVIRRGCLLVVFTPAPSEPEESQESLFDHVTA